jgi:dihydrofolate reductase
MGRIVSNFFISLDGVVERPDQWHFPYFDEAMGRVVESGMETAQAFLMGRNLYREWSEYWPQQEEDAEFAAFINTLPKYVLSHQDFAADWQNTTVLSGPDDASVAAQVRALKDRVSGDIAMSGCATTVRWLIAQGLLDELALLVHPVAVATGQRLFEETGTVPLRLLASETLPTGVLHLRYAPQAPGEGGEQEERASDAGGGTREG